MKQKRKHIFKKLLIFGIVFMLASCSEDLYDESLSNSKRVYSLKEISIYELALNPKFNKAYSRISKESIKNHILSEGRTQIENNYSFKLIDYPAKIIEYDNKTSYSLLIEMDSTQTNELKNLVIEIDSLNKSTNFIVTYKLDESSENNLNLNELLLIEEIAFDPNTNVSSRYNSDCMDVVVIYCSDASKYCGGADTQHGCYRQTTTICSASGANDLGASENILTSPVDSNHQTGGGSGSNNSQPPQTPCETLNDAMQNPSVNQGIQNLKPKTLEEKESAYKIDRKYNSQTESYTYTTTYIDGDNFNTSIETGGYTKGNAHNHPINGQSIPSIGDVFWLMQCQTIIYPASSNGYNIAVCPNPASPNDPSTAIIYAITVDNLATLTDQMNSIYGANFDSLTDKEKSDLLDKKNEEYGKKYEAVQNSSSGMEQKFLQLSANFGVSLYKFDNSTNNWNKLNLINNVATPQPCE